MRSPFSTRAAVFDRATAYFFLGRLYSVFSMPLILVLVGIYLSPEEQGYFYALYSLLGFAVFFELGLSGVLTVVTAKYAHRMTWTQGGRMAGADADKRQLGTLFRKTCGVFGLIAVLFVVVSTVAGHGILASRAAGQLDRLLPAMVCLLVAFGVGLWVGGLLAFVEGLGFVYQVHVARASQLICGSLAIMATLALGGGVWAAALDQTIVSLVGCLWLLGYRRPLADLARTEAPENPLSWRRDVLPLQWRVALSWMAGYFLNHSLVPLLFVLRGPVEAGRMGMTLRISMSAYVLSMGVMQTKAARLSADWAAGRRDDMVRLARRSAAGAVALAVLALIGVAALYVGLDHLWPHATERVLSLWGVTGMMAATVVSVALGCMAAFARAQQQDPFVAANFLTALTVLAALYLGARWASLDTAVLAYLGTYVAVAVPAYLWVFRRFTRPLPGRVPVPVGTEAALCLEKE